MRVAVLLRNRAGWLTSHSKRRSTAPGAREYTQMNMDGLPWPMKFISQAIGLACILRGDEQFDS